MIFASTLRDVRTALLPWREAHETVALVPTMGAIHAGHLMLIAEAKKIAKRAVASIFVNPLQFGPNEDFGKYPRQLEADKKLLSEAGCDLLYAPPMEELYPEGFVTKIDPGPMANMLEGAFRPGHFCGVATVVTKLLLQILPDAALFGDKDYQQLLIIRRVTRDLDIPTHIIGVPIVREADGLALSSRNVYLSADDRKRALALPQGLAEAAGRIAAGEDVGLALAAGRAKMMEAGFAVDYFELVDAVALVPMRSFKNPARLLAAARINGTRLIDNMAVGV